MKRIVYQFAVATAGAQEPVTYLQEKSILCSNDMLDANLLAAKEEAYDGLISVEDADPELYPEPQPTTSERMGALESALMSLIMGEPIDTEFLRIQYLLGNLTQESIQSAVPLRLTEDQANAITGGIET